MQRDVFISHAGPDKELARGIAAGLRAGGLSVWLDEYELTLGDYLRREIERGLASSRLGVVILSPAFFQREWPQRELDGLVATETADDHSRILPVWHGLGKGEVAQRSPALAGVDAVNSADGLDAVIGAIVEHVRRGVAAIPERSYSHVFEDEAVDLVQWARTHDGVLEDIYFLRCELRGPAVLVPHPSNTYFGMAFSESMLWDIDPAKPHAGWIPTIGCRFEKSHWIDIGFAAPRSYWDDIAIFGDSAAGG